jgi:ribonucleotide reductase alpha subunit
VESQIETGNPYMVYKDSINRKTNHQNLGVIKSSNLCAEIAEYSSKDETSVCNLASISLPHFLSDDNKTFDFDKLYEITQVLTNNIDRVIDANHYVDEPTKRANEKSRPMAIGVQGLADVFARMKLPFESEEANKLNREIYETIYYAAVDKSADLAKERGEYPAFKGSPASKGILQPDM